MSQYEELKAMIQKITPKTYDKIADLPEYAKATIQKLVDKKAITGVAPGKLGLTEDMVRIFCILDGAKVFSNL